MARTKGEPSKVYCARVKADIFEPVERIKQSGVRVSELIREGLRKEISARSGFEKQAVKELQRASSPAEVVEIAAALVEAAETPKEEAFVEKAATAALDAVSSAPRPAKAPLQLTAAKYRNFSEEVLGELRQAKNLDDYRATSDRLAKEAKRLGSTALKAYYVAQREARGELDEALRLKREQAKQIAKLQKAQAKAAKPKKTPAPKKPKAPKAPKAKPAPKPKAEKKPKPAPKPKQLPAAKPEKKKSPESSALSLAVSQESPADVARAERILRDFIKTKEARGFADVRDEFKARDLAVDFIKLGSEYHPDQTPIELREIANRHSALSVMWFDKNERAQGLWHRALYFGWDMLADAKERAPRRKNSGDELPKLKASKEERERAKNLKLYAQDMTKETDNGLMFERDRQEAKLQRAQREGNTSGVVLQRQMVEVIGAELSKRAAAVALVAINRAGTISELEAARDEALKYPGKATEKILPAYDKKRAALLKKEKSVEASRQAMSEGRKARAEAIERRAKKKTEVVEVTLKDLPRPPGQELVHVFTKGNEGAIQYMLPKGLGARELLRQVSEKSGLKLFSRGSKGPTEIQTDAGIWKRPGGGVLVNNKGELFPDVAFRSWETIEREELQNEEQTKAETARATTPDDFIQQIYTKLGRAPKTIKELYKASALISFNVTKEQRKAFQDAINSERQRIKTKPPKEKKASGENCSTATAPLMLGSKTSAGLEKVPARYCLVDVYDLKASNKPLSGFGYTEGYPRDAQERDYFHDKNEQLKVLEIARQFEPALVFNGNPGAIDGMPVVNQDGIVLGGNGRTMAAMIAYSEGDQAQKIRDYLKDNAKLFGFTARQIAKVPYPFLVRRIQTSGEPEELAAWSRRLNETLSQQLDKTALAVSRAKFLPASVLQAMKIPDDMSVGAWLSSMDSKPFVEGLKSVGIIDARNFKLFIDPQNGLLTADGRDVIVDLIVAVLIPDAQLLKSLGPGVTATIARGAPYLAELRTWVNSPYNVSGQLFQALEAFVDWRSKDMSIMSYIGQGSLLGAQRSKMVNLWLKIVHDLAASPVRFMKVCRAYAQEARGPANGQVALFSAESRTPFQMLQAAAAAEGVTDLKAI